MTKAVGVSYSTAASSVDDTSFNKWFQLPLKISLVVKRLDCASETSCTA